MMHENKNACSDGAIEWDGTSEPLAPPLRTFGLREEVRNKGTEIESRVASRIPGRRRAASVLLSTPW